MQSIGATGGVCYCCQLPAPVNQGAGQVAGVSGGVVPGAGAMPAGASAVPGAGPTTAGGSQEMVTALTGIVGALQGLVTALQGMVALLTQQVQASQTGGGGAQAGQNMLGAGGAQAPGAGSGASAQQPAPTQSSAPAPSATPATPPPDNGKYHRPVGGNITQHFGGGSNHPGLDTSAVTGTHVEAAADGEVEFAGQQSGYGNIIIIRHADGKRTAYAHLNAIKVQQGQKVSRADYIGDVGSTGNSTGPHLHFEVRSPDGKKLNPEDFIG